MCGILKNSSRQFKTKYSEKKCNGRITFSFDIGGKVMKVVRIRQCKAKIRQTEN